MGHGSEKMDFLPFVWYRFALGVLGIVVAVMRS